MESYGPRTRRSAAREAAEGAGMARRTRSSVVRAAAASSVVPRAGRSRRGRAQRTSVVAVAASGTTTGATNDVVARRPAAADAGADASAVPFRAIAPRQEANLFLAPRTPLRENATRAAAVPAAPYTPASTSTPDNHARDHSNKENSAGGVEAEGLKTPVARRGGDCAICLSPLKQAEGHRQQSELYTIQGCGHNFHRACLVENRRVGNAGCPCCRGAMEQGLTPAPTAAERRVAEERAAEAQAIESAQSSARSMVMEVSAAMRDARQVRSAAEAALTRAAIAESAAAAAVTARAEAEGIRGPALGIAAATARGGVAVAVAEAAAAAERAADTADSTAISALANLSLFGGSAGATIDGLTAAIEASRAVLATARGELEASRAAVNAVAMEGAGEEVVAEGGLF